jgi:hypothetical protein
MNSRATIIALSGSLIVLILGIVISHHNTPSTPQTTTITQAAPVKQPVPEGRENYIGFPNVIDAYLVAYPKCRKVKNGWPSSACLAGVWAANIAYADAHPEMDDQSQCLLNSPAGTFFSKRCRTERQRISDTIETEDAKQHVHVCINGNCATSSVWTDANGDVHITAQKD